VEAVSRVPVRYLVARPTSPRGAPAARPTVSSSTTAKPPTAVPAAAPPPADTLWNLRKVRWSDARAVVNFKDGSDIRVAVLDSGIDPGHPDLAGRVAAYTYLHPDLPKAASAEDLIGHGTHVSGTIAALVNNGLGINGICASPLLCWKIFDDVVDYDPWSNSFLYYVEPVMYRRALAACVQEKVDVVNLSIGGPGAPDHQELDLFQQMMAQGTTVVAAMGNERQQGSPTSYPAAIKGVVAVGATTLNDTVASFSNRGTHISLSAPGTAIWSTLPRYGGQFGFDAVKGPAGNPVEGKPHKRETDYDAWSGTSMATPHVTAAVALLHANRGKASPVAVRDRLMATADKVAGMSDTFDADFGAGRLNLLNLLL
jgi:subtilisin family serine protease